jgi:hypothetical protein
MPVLPDKRRILADDEKSKKCLQALALWGWGSFKTPAGAPFIPSAPQSMKPASAWLLRQWLKLELILYAQEQVKREEEQKKAVAKMRARTPEEIEAERVRQEVMVEEQRAAFRREQAARSNS